METRFDDSFILLCTGLNGNKSKLILAPSNNPFHLLYSLRLTFLRLYSLDELKMLFCKDLYYHLCTVLLFNQLSYYRRWLNRKGALVFFPSNEGANLFHRFGSLTHNHHHQHCYFWRAVIQSIITLLLHHIPLFY